jgi:hypothetical protein
MEVSNLGQPERDCAGKRLRWREPAAYRKDRSTLSLERDPHKKKTVTIKQ